MKISRIMSISRILIDLCVIRQKAGIKKNFWRFCLKFFSSQKVWWKHLLKVCLKMSGKQSVKLSGSIKFKNRFKHSVVPFKIYSDFESGLKKVQSNDNENNTSYTKINLLKQFLKKWILQKMIGKHFDGALVVFEEDEKSIK